MTELDLSALTFAAPARVSARQSTPELRAAAAARVALDPSVFDSHPPYFFRAEISNTRVDSYFTHMDAETTLANFARDASAGVAFLANHNSYRLPFGRSLEGALLPGAELTRVEADFYTIPGLSVDAQNTSDQVITGMRAGIVADVSVGFSFDAGGMFRCDICGNDVMNWAACSHYPGMTYEIKGPDGVIRQQLATATVLNARLSEVSAVYDGATPGAVILKAQSAAERGRVGLDVERMLAQRYRINLPGRRLLVPGADVKGQGDMPAENPEQEQQRAAELETPAAEAVAVSVAIADLRAVLGDEMRASAEGALESVRALAERETASAARVAELERQIATLEPIAAEGRAARDELLESAITEGVRAFGATWDAEQHRKMLGALPLATVREMRAAWQQLGDARLTGGRATVTAPEKQATTARGRAPIAAYQD